LKVIPRAKLGGQKGKEVIRCGENKEVLHITSFKLHILPFA